VVPGSAA
ncbi:hypothetical protein ECTT12B_1597, partial [Escherichia coli TT12B]